MGILADLLAAPLTYSNTPGVGRHVYRNLEDILRTYGDFDYPSGFNTANEVQGIAVHSGTVSGGTFTLTPQVTGAVATGNINHNANAATIQTAIDTAMTGVAGYVAGHLAITGGPLTTTPLVLTYSGASVDATNYALVVGDGALLTGGGTLGAITQTTAGQSARAAWAFLKVAGIITSAPPDQGSSGTPTVGSGRGQFPFKLNNDTVIALIEEAASKDGGIAAVKTSLLTALRLP